MLAAMAEAKEEADSRSTDLGGSAVTDTRGALAEADWADEAEGGFLAVILSAAACSDDAEADLTDFGKAAKRRRRLDPQQKQPRREPCAFDCGVPSRSALAGGAEAGSSSSSEVAAALLHAEYEVHENGAGDCLDMARAARCGAVKVW